MTLRPLSTYYHVSPLASETETAAGIALPDAMVETPTEFQVLAVGEGRLRDDGTREPMQAAVGDLVTVQAHHVVPMSDGSAFVSDDDLVCIRRVQWWDKDGKLGDFGDIEPAGEWVAVVPEPVYALDETGATVQAARPSGVLVVGAGAMGGTAREARRGQELYDEWGRIAKGDEYRLAANEYERHRLMHKWMDGLCAWERAALGDAIRKGGKTDWDARQVITMRERSMRGTLVTMGRAAVDVIAPTEPWKSVTNLPWDRHNGSPKVHWEPGAAVSITTPEGTHLRMVKASDLAAVEV